MFMNTIFGPTLSADYCLYFYILSILFFLAALVALVGVVVLFGDIVKNYKLIITGTYSAGLAGLMYLSNRLLYTMCSNSIH